MKFFIRLFAVLLVFANSKTNAQVNLANIKYPVFTYNEASPTVNPFKNDGVDISWADHTSFVDANKMSYMRYPMNDKSRYLTEALYCIKQNEAAINRVLTMPEHALWILQNGKPVIEENFPAGRLLVLGITPNGQIKAFLNPSYKKVQLVEYTDQNGKIYVSKYSGAGKECCINLVIDLYPRTTGRGQIQYIHDTLIIDHTTVVHDRNVYNTTVHEKEVFEVRSGPNWYPIPRVPYFAPGYYCMPLSYCMPIFGCLPPYRCHSRGVECALVQRTPQNIITINNYITISNTTNVTVINNTNPVVVVHPETPRPVDVPLYNNTGGGGSYVVNTTGGGDVPGNTGTNTTAGGGTGTENTGGVGKKEWTEVPPQGWNQTTTETGRPIMSSDPNGLLANNQTNYYDEFFRPAAGSNNIPSGYYDASSYTGSNNSGYNNSYIPNYSTGYNPNYSNGSNYQGTGLIGNASNSANVQQNRSYDRFSQNTNQNYGNTQTYNYTNNTSSNSSSGQQYNYSEQNRPSNQQPSMSYPEVNRGGNGGGGSQSQPQQYARPSQGTGSFGRR